MRLRSFVRSPKVVTGVLLGGITVGLIGGGVALVDHFSGSATVDPLGGRVGLLVGAAAVERVPGGAVKRLDPDGPGRWQVGLVDVSGACWRVAVLYQAGTAAPVGERAAVGCWDQPRAVTKGDPAEAKVDQAARGFLAGFVGGGDYSRFAKADVTFLSPPPGTLTVGTVTQSTDGQGGWVAVVTGTLGPAAKASSSSPVSVEYRLHLVAADVGPVVDRVGAGPSITDVTMGPPVATTVASSTSTTASLKRE